LNSPVHETESKVAFTPGPWTYSHRMIPGDKDGMYATQIYDCAGVTIATADWYPVRGTRCVSTNREENARLIAAAPEMYEALKNVQKLIAEAAMVGFNCNDGDWPERLFLSQQKTSTAIRKAQGNQP
jgi:hypothetical protein